MPKIVPPILRILTIRHTRHNVTKNRRSAPVWGVFRHRPERPETVRFTDFSVPPERGIFMPNGAAIFL